MIFSCNKSEFTEVIIQGNIVNPMGNTIQLVGPGEMEDGTLNLNFQRETNVDENGNFIDTLNLNLQSNLLLSPTKIDGEISFNQIQLEKIYSYLEDDLKFQFKGLVKNISTTFNANLQNNEITAELHNFNVDIPHINYNDTTFNLTSNDLNSLRLKMNCTLCLSISHLAD